jgi:hypothetical protein
MSTTTRFAIVTGSVLGMLLSMATAWVPLSVLAQTPTATTGVNNTGSGATTGVNNTGSSPCGSSAASGGLKNPLNNICNLQQLLDAILGAIVDLGSIFLIFMLVYVGFLFVAAQGNEEKIRGARAALIWTLIGGLILLGAKAISLVISSTVSTL